MNDDKMYEWAMDQAQRIDEAVRVLNEASPAAIAPAIRKQLIEILRGVKS